MGVDPDGTDVPLSSTAWKIVCLLEAVVASKQGIGVRELARATGIDKSAISRLFGQLQTIGVVEQAEATGRFTVGPRLFALSATIRERDTLWKATEPILTTLVQKFNETCYLATRERDMVIFREKIDCDQAIRYVIELGQASPLHAGAGGRAILAGMTTAEVEEFLATADLKGLTSDTITDPEELRHQISEDHRRRYSVSTGERVVGGSAVAAPYFTADGTCFGSIVFTCPRERFDVRRIPEIADAVVAASQDLSTRLGALPQPDASHWPDATQHS